MRLTIEHKTHYRFERPAHHSIQYLRLTPRADSSQSVIAWTVTTPGKIKRWIDGFGNVAHVSVQNGVHDEVPVTVRGEVETIDTCGMLPADDGLPPLMFLRPTHYTEVTPAIAAFAEPFRERAEDEGTIAALHAMMLSVHTTLGYQPGFTDVETTASEALEQGSGVCQDHAHLFIACCRVISAPARYVSGYLYAKTEDAAEPRQPRLGGSLYRRQGRLGIVRSDQQPQRHRRLRPSRRRLRLRRRSADPRRPQGRRHRGDERPRLGGPGTGPRWQPDRRARAPASRTRSRGCSGLKAGVAGGPAADLRGKTHHHGFGDDQTAAQVEIPCHLLFVDDEPAELAWLSAPAVSTKLSGIAIHSACQGPVARSKSWTMASSMRPACWRTAFAAASIGSEEIGLRFCGIVEEAPRPLTNGS